MRIVACIKQVPDTTQVQIDPVTNTLVREGIPFIVNPYDTHAIEESLQLKDRFGLRVTAISMGPPNAEATLRKALALGVDDAILLSDRVFGGADTLATSNVLATAIERLRFLRFMALPPHIGPGRGRLGRKNVLPARVPGFRLAKGGRPSAPPGEGISRECADVGWKEQKMLFDVIWMFRTLLIQDSIPDRSADLVIFHFFITFL